MARNKKDGGYGEKPQEGARPSPGLILMPYMRMVSKDSGREEEKQHMVLYGQRGFQSHRP